MVGDIGGEGGTLSLGGQSCRVPVLRLGSPRRTGFARSDRGGNHDRADHPEWRQREATQAGADPRNEVGDLLVGDRGDMSQAEAARHWGVDVSVITNIRRTVKDAARAVSGSTITGLLTQLWVS